MITKSMQQFYLLVYKILGFLVLSSMIIGILIYGFSLLFFTFSSSWAAPMVLSPSQERVLSYQPQIANLMSNLEKQRVDLMTAEKTASMYSERVVELRSLIARIERASKNEASSQSVSSKELAKLVVDKQKDIAQTDEVIKNAQALLSQIDSELKSKLITSDQAATRRIALQAAINSATDSKTQALQLKQQIQQLSAAASTLNGGASSMIAISQVKQLEEIKALLVQMEIQATTAAASVSSLRRTASESEHVLESAKLSPYYAALKSSVPVAFVPYDNLDGVSSGDEVFDCTLSFFWCKKVGTVSIVYDAEEYARHPLFKTDLKGKFVGINFSEPESASSRVLFIGGKPLFI